MTLLRGIPSKDQMVAAINTLHNTLTANAASTIVKSADQSETGIVLIDDDELQFSVAANETRAFEMAVFTDRLTAVGSGTGVETGGWTFNIVCSGASGRWGLVSEENGDSRPIGTAYLSPNVEHPASQPVFVIRGTVIGASAATCKFQFCQGTDVGAPPDPVIVRQYSHLTHWPVP